ncbi:tripartite tricarboxylate transporter TctB family protein [Mycetocola reblochoni]|uniref:Tricarboxylate transport protein TctB n=2 Tax=Mycetocola reblochoni TaxID=331618 RepID=A0A1R4JA44_9MICO|nr:tripartite tricarboxylate transporter TctB family protein [Mycetocola reblochoni]RLP70052.1 tripartite tricarboxylate transporter TctB family protein [Mycetocola reblochoni]SJN28917.1 Tricarboxylate transport protein TctB [Mycetocola reblochoni REB411]
MSAPETTRGTSAAPATRWWNGRGELGVALGVAVLGVLMLLGTATMDVPEGAGTPGPQFFPTIVGCFMLVLAVALAVGVIRHPRRPGPDEPSELNADMLADLGNVESTTELRIVSGDPDLASRSATPTAPRAAGVRPVLMVVAALAGFILILDPLGWLLSAAALFWVVARALGSTRPLFDIAIALLMSSAVQLAFSAGLGLTLPSGILTGAFSWIN